MGRIVNTPATVGALMNGKFGCLTLWAILCGIVSPCAQSSTVTYIYSNPQGTPLMESDSNGNVSAPVDYRPYGSVAVGDIPRGPGYTGHVNDADTGLVYMQARYYDPSTARFLSIDSKSVDAGSIFSFNRFAYARNNTLSYIDPDGRDALWVNGADGRSHLVIPVHFVGAAATKENIGAIVHAASRLQVLSNAFTVKVVATSTPVEGVLNTLDLSSGKDFKSYPLAGEGVNAVGGNTGHIDSSSANWIRAALHDTLHFAGLTDGYRDTGKPGEARTTVILNGYTQDDIMAERSGNNVSPQELERARSNATTKQCQQGADGKMTCN